MSITVNMDKAKTIGHEIRRAKRADEFAPLDAEIAKQIPGTDTAAVEAQRQTIRDKYAGVQMQIDAANKAAADAKAAFLPSVLGTAVGAYGTSEYGQEQLKGLWDKFSSQSAPTPGNGAAPSAAFTGSASLYRK